MSVLGGSLLYKKDSNSFQVNEVGTVDGWVPMPIGLTPQDLTKENSDLLLSYFGGSNQSKIYVDITNPNSTDVKNNNGSSVLRPFRTIQRALFEVARRSFRKGSDNDIFERVTISIAPGEYTIYNDPSNLDTQVESAPAFPENAEPDKAFYVKFNSKDRAGVFLPRGITISGAALRKVIIRPSYVPPKDGSEGRGSIFRMTGGNFFSGFTVKDKAGANESHHNLSVFDFSRESELNEYYDKINGSFADYNIYHRAQDAANLIEKNRDWVIDQTISGLVIGAGNENYANIFFGELPEYLASVVRDLRLQSTENVLEFAKKFRESHVDTLQLGPTPETELTSVYQSFFTNCQQYVITALQNEATGTYSFTDPYVIIDQSDTRCADIISAVDTYRDIVIDILVNGVDSITVPEFDPLEITTFSQAEVAPVDKEFEIVSEVDFQNPTTSISTVGASPYIFSATLRSEYGMCGIDGDGADVEGFKSYLVAQFTIISLQKDPDAFISGDDLAAKQVGGKRYKGSSVSDENDYTNFGYRVRNGAYAQLVSCFCIGPARHYVTESGGEFSITNSTSNFGDVSLYSRGFNDDGLGGGAYPPDTEHKLLGVIKPKNFDISDITKATNIQVGSIKSYQYVDSSTLSSAQGGLESAYDNIGNTTDGRQQYINALFDLDWSDPDSMWKSWTETYLDNEVRGSLGEAERRKVTYPDYAEFESISLVKLTLNGKISQLGLNIDKYEDGSPDLRWIYTSSQAANPDIDNATLVKEREQVLTINDNKFPFVYYYAPNIAGNALPGWYINPDYAGSQAASYYSTNDYPYRIELRSVNTGTTENPIYVNVAYDLVPNTAYDSTYNPAPYAFTPSGTATFFESGLEVTVTTGTWGLNPLWDTTGAGHSVYVYDKVQNYNATVSTKRRAPVLAVRENATLNVTEIIIAVGSSGFTDYIGYTGQTGLSNVGEWFERSSIFALENLPYNSITTDTSTSRLPRRFLSYSTFSTRLVGQPIYVKRFVDPRNSDEKKYKFVFRQLDITKRIPPLNYILRESGVDAATQPFKEVGTTQNTLYYTYNPQKFTATDLTDLADPTYTTFSSIDATLANDSNLVFVTELLSANSDSEFRAQTDLDIVSNAKFNLYEDAEALVDKTIGDREDYVNIPYFDAVSREPADSYLSYYNTNNVLGLASTITASLHQTALSVNPDNNSTRFIKITKDGGSEQYAVDFNKPSIIRAAGQTWEYCGYYNYDTALPSLQTTVLGVNDNILPGEQARFRFEKIQTSLAGGRIYSTGMDELGNIVQGNSYIDLATGEIQDVALGTSVEVAAIISDTDTTTGTTGGGSEEITSDSIVLTGTFTALTGSTMDLTQSAVEIDCGDFTNPA